MYRAFPLLQQRAGMGDLLRGQSQRTARLQTVRKKGSAYKLGGNNAPAAKTKRPRLVCAVALLVTLSSKAISGKEFTSSGW